VNLRCNEINAYVFCDEIEVIKGTHKISDVKFENKLVYSKDILRKFPGK